MSPPGHQRRRPDFGLRTSDFGLKARTLLVGLAVAFSLHPAALQARTACFGQSDSPMAKGMNWGILSLLAVVIFVLSGLAAFFVYLGRKSAALATPSPTGNSF